MNLRKSTLALLLLGTGAAFGQSAAIVGAGYTAPVPLTVAPGQVITIYASGVGTKVTERVAATTEPLPRSLGGISVSLLQSYTPHVVPVPLLAVFPVSTCVGQGLAPCSTLLGVTIQVPFELAVNTPGALRPPNIAELTVSDSTGATTGAVDLNAVLDQVHISRYGDSILPQGGIGPVVTHANGNLVSSTNPASVGEVLVLYAAGLGATNPAAGTGDPSPATPARTVTQFAVNFDYRPDATPSNILIGPQTRALLTPLFSGLVPGMTGVYQINFQVPAPTAGVAACGPDVHSNLTVTVIGASSFDGAGICVGGGAFASALPSTVTVPGANFVPNTIWFPPGADISNLGQPVPPGATGLPPGEKIGVAEPVPPPPNP